MNKNPLWHVNLELRNNLLNDPTNGSEKVTPQTEATGITIEPLGSQVFTSTLTTTTNSIKSPITTSLLTKTPPLPQTEVAESENQTNWDLPDHTKTPDPVKDHAPGEPVAAPETEIPSNIPDPSMNKTPREPDAVPAIEVPSDGAKVDEEKDHLEAEITPPDTTNSTLNKEPNKSTMEQSKLNDSPSLEEAAASGEEAVKNTPVSTTPSFIKPPDTGHLSSKTRTRHNGRNSLNNILDITNEHKEKRALALISKLTKIVTMANYNKGVIQHNIFDMSPEAFASSDIAQSFTTIEDYEKRINAKKIKVIERETLIWMYNTLMERVVPSE